MNKRRDQPGRDAGPGEQATNQRQTSKAQSGLYGSQAPKPGARHPSGDTVVQAKPAGNKFHGDKLSQPGYLEEAAEHESQESLRRGDVSMPQNRSKAPRSQRRANSKRVP
jgi:hypothetical protein